MASMMELFARIGNTSGNIPLIQVTMWGGDGGGRDGLLTLRMLGEASHIELKAVERVGRKLGFVFSVVVA